MLRCHLHSKTMLMQQHAQGAGILNWIEIHLCCVAYMTSLLCMDATEPLWPLTGPELVVYKQQPCGCDSHRLSCVCVFFRDNGESWRQQPATTGGHRFSVLEAVCRLRGQNRRPFPPLHHGQLLAQPMPQVFLLPGPAGRNRHVLLHKKRHDPVQKRLHEVRKRVCNAFIRYFDLSSLLWKKCVSKSDIFISHLAWMFKEKKENFTSEKKSWNRLRERTESSLKLT